MALARAREAVRAGGAEVPAHLRDGHYATAAAFGHGVGYQYPHDFTGHWVAQQYLPDDVVGQTIYEPADTGAEPMQVQRWQQRRGVEGTDASQVE